ncbi:MAG: hypothetical protein KC457_15290, partial [Myxococcales bacterium]|nr:hypothetical protein [Myxococcales bacterium]
MPVLADERHLALELVKRCGEIALRIQSGGASSLDAREKPDAQGPVTRADLAVEAEIIRTLREAYPDDAILAEESARDQVWSQAERVWMIDPVDGTKDFAEGSSSWAIHIGLCIDGVPALGVVHEPGSDRTSWAIIHGDQRMAWTRTNGNAASALHGIG